MNDIVDYYSKIFSYWCTFIWTNWRLNEYTIVYTKASEEYNLLVRGSSWTSHHFQCSLLFSFHTNSVLHSHCLYNWSSLVCFFLGGGGNFTDRQIYGWIHIHTHAHVRTHTNLHIHRYLLCIPCIYIHTHTHTHAHTHTHTHTYTNTHISHTPHTIK